MQSPCDFKPDRDTAAGKREHNQVGRILQLTQFLSEKLTGFGSIVKAHPRSSLRHPTIKPVWAAGEISFVRQEFSTWFQSKSRRGTSLD
jgi:hypothetical protein